MSAKNTTIAHLPAHKQQELNSIVSILKEFKETEMLVLFGSYARGDYKEDMYVEEGITYEYKSDYDLLLVFAKEGLAGDEKFTHGITDKLNALGLPTPINAIYHGIDYINKQISSGNYFFNEISKEGIVLFSSEKFNLSSFKKLDTKELKENAERDFKNWLDGANMFFEDFVSNFEKGSNDIKYYKQSAFQLHQATERYYNTVQLVFTGYKPKTHNLDILSKQVETIDKRFRAVFPRKSTEEIERFTLLKQAYVDARYNMHYSISKEALAYLAERVKLLRDVCEKACGERISGL